MKEYTVTLTEKEINAIMTALSSHVLELMKRADHLSDHNKTGINTQKIKDFRDWSDFEDKIWDKLYDIAR